MYPSPQAAPRLRPRLLSPRERVRARRDGRRLLGTTSGRIRRRLARTRNAREAAVVQRQPRCPARTTQCHPERVTSCHLRRGSLGHRPAKPRGAIPPRRPPAFSTGGRAALNARVRDRTPYERLDSSVVWCPNERSNCTVATKSAAGTQSASAPRESKRFRSWSNWGVSSGRSRMLALARKQLPAAPCCIPIVGKAA